MAIGSLSKAGRVDQLRTFAWVQVCSGYRTAAQVRAETYDALVAELGDSAEAQRLTDEYTTDAGRRLETDAAGWPAVTDHDRLVRAFDELAAADVMVLEACDDHWAAQETLDARAGQGSRPHGIAWFTHPDVWHAVEHGMLEVNLWHGDGANVADDDRLLAEVIETFARNGLAAVFDEGRIEVSLAWHRRPTPAAGD